MDNRYPKDEDWGTHEMLPKPKVKAVAKSPDSGLKAPP
jgi:hypothetical protein